MNWVNTPDVLDILEIKRSPFKYNGAFSSKTARIPFGEI